MRFVDFVRDKSPSNHAQETIQVVVARSENLPDVATEADLDRFTKAICETEIAKKASGGLDQIRSGVMQWFKRWRAWNEKSAARRRAPATPRSFMRRSRAVSSVGD